MLEYLELHILPAIKYILREVTERVDVSLIAQQSLLNAQENGQQLPIISRRNGQTTSYNSSPFKFPLNCFGWYVFDKYKE